MRILYIHEVNYRKKVIFEMHEFPELLSLRGHQVSFFEYPEGQLEGIRLKTIKQKIQGRVYPDSSIELITPPNFGGRGLERYFAPIFAFFSLKKILNKDNFDVVVLLAVPTSGWQALYLANKRNIPVLFRALDVSHQIRKSIFSPLIKACEKYIYKNVAVLSANTPSMEAYCVSLSKRTKKSVVNLPPVDLEHFVNPQNGLTRRDLGLTEKHQVLVYMGSFFSFSGLHQVIDDFHEASQNNTELRLVMVGGGELDEALRKQVERLGLTQKVIFTGIVPYLQLPNYLQIADVAINPFEKELLTDVALPHKVLQYMAAGVPTVSTSLDGIRTVLGENCGVTWCASPNQVLATSIDLINKSLNSRAAIIKKQKHTIDQLFDLNLVTNAMETTIASAVSNERSNTSSS